MTNIESTINKYNYPISFRDIDYKIKYANNSCLLFYIKTKITHIDQLYNTTVFDYQKYNPNTKTLMNDAILCEKNTIKYQTNQFVPLKALKLMNNTIVQIKKQTEVVTKNNKMVGYFVHTKIQPLKHDLYCKRFEQYVSIYKNELLASKNFCIDHNFNKQYSPTLLKSILITLDEQTLKEYKQKINHHTYYNCRRNIIELNINKIKQKITDKDEQTEMLINMIYNTYS